MFFFAIISHKLIAAFTLGVLLNDGIPNVLFNVFLLLSFALSTPSGIIIGMFLRLLQNNVVKLISGFTLSFAAGAFLHITFFEILARIEAKKIWHIIIHAISFFTGFTAMAILAIFE